MTNYQTERDLYFAMVELQKVATARNELEAKVKELEAELKVLRSESDIKECYEDDE